MYIIHIILHIIHRCVVFLANSELVNFNGPYIVYMLVDDANLRLRVCISYARAVNTRAAEEEEETRGRDSRSAIFIEDRQAGK